MGRVAGEPTASHRRLLLWTAGFGGTVSALIVGAWFSLTESLLDPSGAALGRDFVNLWTASWAIRHGDLLAIFDPHRFFAIQADLFGSRSLHFWSYPPNALLVAAPLSLLPYLPAFIAWNLVTGAALWAGLRTFAPSGTLTALLLIAPSTFANILFGQNGFLTGALLLGGLGLLHRRPLVAGVLLGLLVFKPQLGFLLPFALIAGRHWKTLAAATASALVEITLSILFFGAPSWWAYLTVTLPFQNEYLATGQGLFLLLMPTVFAVSRLAGLAAEPAFSLQAVATLAMIHVVIRSFAHHRGAGADRSLRAAILFVATMLASPIAFVYDMATVSATVIVLAVHAEGRTTRRGEGVVLAAAWLLPLLQPVPAYYGVPMGPAVLAALLWFLLRRLHATSAR